VWRIESLLWSLLANAIALGVCVAVFSGISASSVGTLLEAALVFGVLNTFVKPLVKLITLPLAVITLRLIWFAVAMAMLKLTAILISGFKIHGFLTLVWATLLVWAVNLVLDLAPGPWRGTRRDHRALSKRKS
jgi:putative membrane protein